MHSTTMTIRVSTTVKDKLARLAEGTHRSRSYLAAAAVSAYVDRELAIIEGVRQGLADLETGHVTSHDAVLAEAQQILVAARQGKAPRP